MNLFLNRVISFEYSLLFKFTKWRRKLQISTFGSTEGFQHFEFWCDNISSTVAPEIESSGSKGNCHHAQSKVSSVTSQHEHSQLRILICRRCPGRHGEGGVSMQRAGCVTALQKWGWKQWHPVTAPPHLCGCHLQGHGGGGEQEKVRDTFPEGLSGGGDTLGCSLHRSSHLAPSGQGTRGQPGQSSWAGAVTGRRL